MNKLRRNFERAIQELRDWEDKLTPDQAQVIAKTDNQSTAYSTIEISPVGVDEAGKEEKRRTHFIKVQEEPLTSLAMTRRKRRNDG